jgi:hypothetical protein
MKSIAARIEFYKLAVLCLTGIAILSVVVYIAFTAAVIFATASRTSMGHERKALTSQIGELERTYLSLESGITEAEAVRRGFTAPAHVSYVERPSADRLSLLAQ